MASAGSHDNSSQFFFTLGRADELTNKHTLFGKVRGSERSGNGRREEGRRKKETQWIHACSSPGFPLGRGRERESATHAISHRDKAK